MRRGLRYAVLALALLLLAAGVHQMLRSDDALRSEDSGVALGLMLLDREQGVYVLAVTQDSAADKAGVLPGDYLLRAGDVPLKEASQLDAQLGENMDELLLLLRREEEELLVQLPLH